MKEPQVCLVVSVPRRQVAELLDVIRPYRCAVYNPYDNFTIDPIGVLEGDLKTGDISYLY